MKVAVIKLGSRIAWGGRDTSGGNTETQYIIKLLDKGGLDIDIYTKTLPKDDNPDKYNFYQIISEYDAINDRGYDALVVLNGNVNFFGGAESPEQILNYWMINNFEGQVYYVMCDPSLQLKQIWGSMERKEWGKKYKQEDIEITRNDIIYISQPYNLPEVQKVIDKTGISIADIIHYPLEKFPCTDPINVTCENPSKDLIYGGTMRGNRRIKKMIKFYYGYPDDIKVEMFGKMNEEDLRKTAIKLEGGLTEPEFSKALSHHEYIAKSNDTLTHVVIGDEWYEGNDMPQRCYQSIWASVVTLIDVELDPENRVFGTNGFCSKFNYVADREDVIKRIEALKKNPAMREKIIEEQFKAVNFNEEEFCNNFTQILEEHMNDYLDVPNKALVDAAIEYKEVVEEKEVKPKVVKERKKKRPVKTVDDMIDDIFL